MGDVTLPTPAPGTITVWSDVGCPWGPCTASPVRRSPAARPRRPGCVDHELFLLEDINQAPTRPQSHDAEIPVIGTRAPELHLTLWHRDPSTWPVSTALANEAVHAAKRQSLRASEELDMALRLAFFRDSRCISLLHEVIAVAETCGRIDVGALAAALDDGSARGEMSALRLTSTTCRGARTSSSPGDEIHNPAWSCTGRARPADTR